MKFDSQAQKDLLVQTLAQMQLTIQLNALDPDVIQKSEIYQLKQAIERGEIEDGNTEE